MSFVITIVLAPRILYRGESDYAISGTWCSVEYGKADPIIFPTLYAAHEWVKNNLAIETPRIITLDEFNILKVMMV